MVNDVDLLTETAYATPRSSTAVRDGVHGFFKRIRDSAPLSRLTSRATAATVPSAVDSPIGYGSFYNEYQSLPELIQRNRQHHQPSERHPRVPTLTSDILAMGSNHATSDLDQPKVQNASDGRPQMHASPLPAYAEIDYQSNNTLHNVDYDKSASSSSEFDKSALKAPHLSLKLATHIHNNHENRTELDFADGCHSDESPNSTLPLGTNPVSTFRLSEFERHYEELMRGSVPCPSCMGTGRIPKEREGELVALIPVKDDRLKPRRTAMYVLIAVLTCAAVGSLFAFFLLPRSVQLDGAQRRVYPYAVKPVHCSADNQTCYNVFLFGEVNITNWNYFPVSINEATVTLFLDNQQLTTNRNETQIWAASRETVSSIVPLNFTLQGYFAQIYTIFCLESSPGEVQETPLHLQFTFTVSSSFLSTHSETDSVTTLQYLGCERTSPTTTTTTAPTTTSSKPLLSVKN